VPTEKIEKSVPTFSGIADPKCKCTPDELCRRCAPSGKKDAMIIGEHFAGKFKVSFAEAVRENNLEFIRAKGEEK
jgi:hypothetical protein